MKQTFIALTLLLWPHFVAAEPEAVISDQEEHGSELSLSEPTVAAPEQDVAVRSSEASSTAVVSTVPAGHQVGEDTPLHEAVRRGNLINSRKLLDGGADVDASDSRGDTPLVLAMRRKDLELTKMLLDYGADASKLGGEGVTPLGIAASTGDVVAVKLLIDRGANPHQTDEQGFSPLMRAVAADDLAVVQLLLERGARFEGTTREGKSIGELVKPGGKVSVLPQVPKQVDAAALVNSSSSADLAEEQASAAVSEGSASSAISSSAHYEPVSPSERLTKVRLSTPIGQWQKKKKLTLESVQLEARNVGEVAAKDVKVNVVVPGGEIVTLEGPTQLERNQAARYSAKPGVAVTVSGNLKAEASCSNCRR